MKALIIAAGYGTRFLPVTKSIPKEMLPLITKPAISFVIEELVSSGIKDILIVTSRRKRALEEFLDRDTELETVFKKEGDQAKLDLLDSFSNVNFSFVRQKKMLGTGHAILQARYWIGDEPFMVVYPDDLCVGSPPLSRLMIEQHKKKGKCILATVHDPPLLNRFGVLKIDQASGRVIDIVEKPEPGKEPSKEASIGRYLYDPEIFHWLAKGWEKHTTGEYYHTYALKKMMDKGKVVHTAISPDQWVDTGTPSGYLRAILRYAMQFPDLKEVVKKETENLD